MSLGEWTDAGTIYNSTTDERIIELEVTNEDTPQSDPSRVAGLTVVINHKRIRWNRHEMSLGGRKLFDC